MRAMIEKWLPVSQLSRDAAIEMAYKPIPAYIKHCRELGISLKIGRNFYDPKIRNLHPWFARRPCSIARSTTLASILPDSVNREDFERAIGLAHKASVFIKERYPPLIFYTDPDRNFINTLILNTTGKRADEIITCDPMAGGGTIPLENLRLGFKSIGIEYNPVAYLILKGTVEYPAKFGKELAKRVREESIKMISFVREKLGKYYPKDCEGYIFARGVHCPSCNGTIPLLHDTAIDHSTFLWLQFDKLTRTFKTVISPHPQKLPLFISKGKVKCPYCGFEITKQQAYKIWTENHVELLQMLRNGQLNEEKILKTHILLVKQTHGGYINPDDEDISAFLDSCRDLARFSQEIWEYLPGDDIPKENEVFSPLRTYGIRKWYELFNPRQLLALSTLIKYIRDLCDVTFPKDSLHEAILLYLTMGVSRITDYNSIITTWKKGTIRDTIGRYAQNRKITYGEEYCEAIIPYRNIEWIFEARSLNNNRTQGGICPIVDELCKRLDGLGSNVHVIHGDCRFLSSMLTKRIDVINVDPPYFDQQIYSDISEYFWQFFRICLKPLIEKKVYFNSGTISDWNPSSPTVPREGEIIVRKSKNLNDKSEPYSGKWYTAQMGIFFKECNKVLRDDGVLLTWFTHRSMEAWSSIVSSLYTGGFYVTRVWPFVTELLTRLVSRQSEHTFNQTLIIVSRKRFGERKFDEEMIKSHALDLVEKLCSALGLVGATKREFYTFLQASAICSVTLVEPPENADPTEYFYSDLLPLATKIANELKTTVLEDRYRPFYVNRKLEEFF
jgi:adenine-specific DNA methylase